MRQDPLHLEFDEGPGGGWGDDTPAYPPITRLPERELPLQPNEVRQGITMRAKACANMRLEGFSFMEIAEKLEYATAAEAKRDFRRALAASHPPEDWETMRQVESMRAEKLFRQSLAMATAEYLLDEEGNQVPNTERLNWHKQAAADLMNHATISGAKAPSKLEITPGEAQFEELVTQMLERSGHQVVEEADVLELTQIEHPESDEEADVYAEEG